MSLYELLLFLHVAAATIWLGAGFALFMLGIRAGRADDPLEMKRVGEIAQWLTPRLFIPSSFSVLVLGILLTIDGPWGFDQLWILIGLAGFAASFLVGILLIEPTAKAIERTIREQGPGPEVVRLVRKVSIVSRLELIVLFAVVADMAIKPSTDDGWTLVLGVLAMAAVAPVVLVTAPKPAPLAAPVTATN